MPSTTTVSTSQQNNVDQMMARVLRQLCREHGVTREQIRDALPELTDTEFAKLWSGKRAVYVTDAMRISYVFEAPPVQWVYANAVFKALHPDAKVSQPNDQELIP